MQTFEEAREEIITEIRSDNAEARKEYLSLFADDVDEFAIATAHAFMRWRALDSGSGNSKKRAYVSSLVFTAINLNILSLQLFLSGHPIAAGNLFRQVVETISLAILCSAKDLGILDRFIDQKYSTNDAPKHIIRYSKRLGLNDEGVKVLKKAQSFYNKYSHVTPLTTAAFMSFSKKGEIYVGAVFDKGKVESYRKEMRGRVGMAKMFPNFVQGVIANLGKW